MDPRASSFAFAHFTLRKLPAFTIFPDNRARCFGCGWHGDVVDLELALAGGSLLAAAARIGGLGVTEPRPATPKPAEKKIRLPDLETPTEKDLFRLSESRSIAMAPLRIAVSAVSSWHSPTNATDVAGRIRTRRAAALSVAGSTTNCFAWLTAVRPRRPRARART